MAAPTVNEYDESTFSDDANVDELSSSASWVAGDIVLVFGAIANNRTSAGLTLGTPTVSSGSGTGLTFSLSTSVNVENGGGLGDDCTVYLWTATASGTGSGQIASVTGTSSTPEKSGICVIVVRGSDGLGTPVTLDGSTAKTISVTTTQASSIVAVMMADWNQVGDVTVTATPSGTVRHASAQSGEADFFFVTTDDLGAIGTYACGIASHTGTVDMSGIAIEIKGTTSVVALDQEGFRFGLDDDTESAHTWSQSQDTDETTALDETRLLRLIVDATDDPASAAYALRYQKNGSGGYVDVPVGSSGTTYTSPPATPTATTTTVGTASATWNITRPAASSGDMVVFVIAWDDSTTTSSVTAPSGPNGESGVSIAGPQASASTEMRMQAWYYIATGSWSSATDNWTHGGVSETCRAVAFVIPSGEYNSADPVGWSNTRASTGTAETSVNSPTGTAEADDGEGRLYIAFGSDADALTAPGSDWGTINNATGGGVGLCVGSRTTLASNSESVSALTATIAGDSWASIAFIVKADADAVTNEVYVVTSANITAGGEATTARLTAPSGKTTSDFTTGRRWDNENGTDSIDIAADFYTELEWALRVQSPAADTDYFDFRVYADGNPLDTYTDTPRWTIGSGGVSITAGFDQLVITEQASATKLSRNVVAGADALIVAEQAAAIKLSRNVAAGADSIVITENAANVNRGNVLAANADALVIAEQDAVVNAARVFAAAVDTLVITELAATVAAGSGISASADSLVIAEFAAGLTLSRAIQATTDSLVITEQAGTVKLSKAIAAGIDTLTITEIAGIVNRGLAIAATTDALSIVEQLASLTLARNIAAQVDALLISEGNAAVSVGSSLNASADALVMSEHAAAVNARTSITAAVAALVIAEQQASAKLSRNISAAADILQITEFGAVIALSRAIAAQFDQLTIEEFDAIVEGTPAVVEVVAQRIIRAAARQASVRVGARDSTIIVPSRNNTIH